MGFIAEIVNINQVRNNRYSSPPPWNVYSMIPYHKTIIYSGVFTKGEPGLFYYAGQPDIKLTMMNSVFIIRKRKSKQIEIYLDMI